MCNLHTIRKREKRVRSHYGPIQRESKRLSLFNGLPERVNPAGLTHAAGQKLPVLRQDDCGRLGVLAHLACKQEGSNLGARRGAFGHGFEILLRVRLPVLVLTDKTIEQGFDLTRRLQWTLLDKKDPVF